MFGLTASELKILKRLSTPIKIQDFLDTLPFNLEESKETYMSPRRTLREKKAHCLEGALLAAAALWINGEEPLILDLKAAAPDVDHVVALYKKNDYWGAISKTNHAVLRFRDPIYKTPRELALSYFHEYFWNENGKKMLRSFAGPYDLRKLGSGWMTAEEELDIIPERLDGLKHIPLVPLANKKFLRPADAMERKAGEIVEWKR